MINEAKPKTPFRGPPVSDGSFLVFGTLADTKSANTRRVVHAHVSRWQRRSQPNLRTRQVDTRAILESFSRWRHGVVPVSRVRVLDVKHPPEETVSDNRSSDSAIGEDLCSRTTSSPVAECSPYTLVGHGNSDPFASTVLKLTHHSHLLLQISYKWPLFIDYPIWMAPMYETHAINAQNLAIRDCLGDHDMLHCLLVAGNLMMAHKSVPPSQFYVVRALQHKDIVLRRLRTTLHNHNSTNITSMLYYLCAMEMFEGNTDSSYCHWQALRRLLIRDDQKDQYLWRHVWIHDVWSAYVSKRSTLIDVRSWDPRTQGRWYEERFLPHMVFSDRTPVRTILQQTCLAPETQQILYDYFERLPRFCALVRVGLALPRSSERDDLVNWLHLVQSAMEGHLINFFCQSVPPPPLGIIIAKAITIFGCVMDNDFANNLTTDVIASAVNPFDEYLYFEPLLRQLHNEGLVVDNELTLWLTFMSTLSETICQHKHCYDWSECQFLFLHDRLGLDRRLDQIEKVLRKFLYLDSMRAHLKRLCSLGNGGVLSSSLGTPAAHKRVDAESENEGHPPEMGSCGGL
jgi:hypothetical protein